MGSILGSIRPYLALWAASTPQRDQNRARLTKFLRFDSAQCEDKEINSLISKVRIMVEHVIAGVKRLRIVKEVFRNTKEKFDDLVMEIACGLHNFRTVARSKRSEFG